MLEHDAAHIRSGHLVYICIRQQNLTGQNRQYIVTKTSEGRIVALFALNS